MTLILDLFFLKRKLKKRCLLGLLVVLNFHPESSLCTISSLVFCGGNVGGTWHCLLPSLLGRRGCVSPSLACVRSCMLDQYFKNPMLASTCQNALTENLLNAEEYAFFSWNTGGLLNSKVITLLLELKVRTLP